MKRTFQPKNASESQGAWLPRPHEDQGRPPRPQGPPYARPQGAQRLSAVTAQERPAPSQGLRFPRRFRLGRSRNYRYVYRKGRSFPSRSLVLVYLRGKDLKLGFSVSSKVGNAVTAQPRAPLPARGRTADAPAPEAGEVYLRGPRGRRALHA